MKKSYKIFIIVLSAILVVGATVCVGLSIADGSVGGKTTTESTTVEAVTESTTASNATQSTTATTTPASEDTVIPGADLKADLIGKWMDGANMSGFEFFADGSVKVTYVNVTIPVLNVPINGTYNGVYTMTGNQITTKFSIYTATIEDTYVVEIDNNLLTLTNVEDMQKSSYMKASSEAVSQTTTLPSTTPDTTVGTTQGTTQSTTAASTQGTTLPTGSNDEASLRGSWMDTVGMSGYEFKDANVVTVTYVNMVVPVLNIPINGTFDGSYIVNDGIVSITFSIYGNVIRNSYRFSVNGNTLTLTNTEDNSVSTYIKK